MTVLSLPCLNVLDWGSISWPNLGSDPEQSDPSGEGSVADLKDIPTGLRRRLGQFERAIVQVVLGLSTPGAPVRVSLGSRFGNLNSAALILRAIADGEPPSPTLFSHSVLNAGCGVANQIRADRSSHTAVSAGARTLHETFTEAWLQAGEAGEDAGEGLEHVVVLIDTPFPECYQSFDSGWQTGMCVGLRVAPAIDAQPIDTPVSALGCDGYAALLGHLQQGARSLRLTHDGWGLA